MRSGFHRARLTDTEIQASFRHTFAGRLVNGVKQPDRSLLCLSPKQVADLLGHSTSEITEMFYVKMDNTRLVGITDGFAR